MPGLLVHTGAILTCPHALGAVTANPTSQPRVFVNLVQPVLTISDIHKVAGCPFQIIVGPATKLQPCVIVRLLPAARVFINGKPAALYTPATAICQSIEQIPQGPPNASPIQKRVLAT